MQDGREHPVCTLAANGTCDDIERIDVAGAFPQQPDMCVAHQARVHPLLDVAVAAAHLHGPGRHRHVVAAGPEFEQRCQDAQQALRFV